MFSLLSEDHGDRHNKNLTCERIVKSLKNQIDEIQIWKGNVVSDN